MQKEFKILDDGFVRYIDHMGTDLDIVKSARMSYGKADEDRSETENRALIRYMLSGAFEMKAPHSSPFERCELVLHVRVPMDTWRQWIRHRTASVNEYSTRYTEAIDSCQQTDPNKWRLQSKSNKQGSADFIEFDPEDPNSAGQYLSTKEKELQLYSRQIYQERLKLGIAREQARKDLPLSTYTEAIWKIDLHNLLHFLKLRMDSHAQAEIRNYANIIGNEIVSQLWPLTWEAFQDYVLNSITFSKQELEILNRIIDDQNIYLGMYNLGSLTNEREKKAFLSKLNKISEGTK